MKNPRIELTQEILKDIIFYNHITGDFFWKERTEKYSPVPRTRKTWNARYAGKVAGSVVPVSGINYVNISMLGGMYRAHRLAFLYMTGAWPDNVVDHIDGSGENNSWSNLRQATTSENGRNQRLRKDNSSGQIGVYFYKRTGKWSVRIWNDGKCVFLGYYDSFDDACKARKIADEKYGYSDRHGTADYLKFQEAQK